MSTGITVKHASIFGIEEDIYVTTRHHIWEEFSFFHLPSYICLNYWNWTQCSSYTKRHLEWKLIITNRKCTPSKHGCSWSNQYHDPTVNILRMYTNINTKYNITPCVPVRKLSFGIQLRLACVIWNVAKYALSKTDETNYQQCTKV